MLRTYFKSISPESFSRGSKNTLEPKCSKSSPKTKPGAWRSTGTTWSPDCASPAIRLRRSGSSNWGPSLTARRDWCPAGKCLLAVAARRSPCGPTSPSPPRASWRTTSRLLHSKSWSPPSQLESQLRGASPHPRNQRLQHLVQDQKLWKPSLQSTRQTL